MKYNLLDSEEKIVLENVTLEEVEAFLEGKDSNGFILEMID